MVNTCETPLANGAAKMLGWLHGEGLRCIGEELEGGRGKSGVKKGDSRGERDEVRSQSDRVSEGGEGKRKLSACHGCGIQQSHGTCPVVRTRLPA